MTAWQQPKRLQYRRHANGRVSEVYLQHDGRFYAREALNPGEVGRSLAFRDNVETLKLARAFADRVAHPRCSERCERWQDDPEALKDPECRRVLGERRTA